MKKLVISVFCFLTVFINAQKADAIKIGLVTDANTTYIASSVKGDLINARTNKLLYKLEPMTIYTIKANRNSINIKINGKFYDLGTDSAVLKSEGPGFLSTKNRWYRGEFIINNTNNNLTLINYLKLEEYLLGVVPAEMPSKWNEEALKAQAIAARSYTVANLGKRASKGYDLKDNTEDQAYGGATSETRPTNKAVAETKGIVVTYNKQVIPAYYHASAGGQTNNSGELWTKNLPFLRSVPSYDEGIKKMGHGIGMSQYGANNLAKQGYNAYQILTYFYNNIKFGKLSPEWNI